MRTISIIILVLLAQIAKSQGEFKIGGLIGIAPRQSFIFSIPVSYERKHLAIDLTSSYAISWIESLSLGLNVAADRSRVNMQVLLGASAFLYPQLKPKLSMQTEWSPHGIVRFRFKDACIQLMYITEIKQFVISFGGMGNIWE